MTVIVEVRLSHPHLAMHEARTAVPEMRLHVEHQTWAESGERRDFLWAEGAEFDTFEAALDDDRTVKRWERLEDAGNRRLYRVDLAETAVLPSQARTAVGGSLLSIVAGGDGIDAEIRFADHETLNEYLDRVREMGLDVSVTRIYQSGEDGDGFGYGLSEKQREALTTAAATGYYAVPREADLGDVAAELGISRQAASERLRRAAETLVDETLSGEPHQAKNEK